MFTKMIAATALATATLAGVATAQDGDTFTGPYVVGEVGYENGPVGFDQILVGGAIGYSVPLNQQFFVAGEAEIHWSESDIVDFTWGITGNLGYRLDEDFAVIARAGYRNFNFDTIGSGDDYMLGLGFQYAINDNLSFRPILDTVGFDTIGVRAGLAYSF